MTKYKHASDISEDRKMGQGDDSGDDTSLYRVTEELRQRVRDELTRRGKNETWLNEQIIELRGKGKSGSNLWAMMNGPYPKRGKFSSLVPLVHQVFGWPPPQKEQPFATNALALAGISSDAERQFLEGLAVLSESARAEVLQRASDHMREIAERNLALLKK